ncbi:translation initiation factor [Rhodococcus triatomae]|uniref:Translation initiation factor n=1 Tax=Rhodococcus triatomae TaxID=300028 RepID=A0A1G8GIA3_9NOCA|nr:DUF6319 family protein [Rhodococcus triatomae]QNG20369.1 translation initiation factor [Rhodococcus triatomae]QNG23715.1 translation initiation factor [Rhodococcus triatomae]SDH94113.1 hypothetical protein SAMN05444695_104111 [Rhodococcus triatomae]
MPPRTRAGASGLTAENLATLAAAIAEGRRSTVYLREAMPSLGLEAGTSAKALSVSGNTVVIRPKGVDDELPFEAEELLASRPKPAAGATPARAASKAGGTKTELAVHQGIEPGPPPAPKPRTSSAAPVAASSAEPPAPRKRAPAKKKAPAAVAVTIHAGADGEWSVAVTPGAKRPAKSTPVTADAVERAVRELGDPATVDAVESILAVARESAAAKVEELSRQLEEARAALEALGAAD